VEAQADAADGLDPRGVAELLAQGGDVDVDRLRAAVPRRLPDLLQDLRARHDRTRFPREQREQVELLWCQVELAPVYTRPTPAHVQLERADERASKRGPFVRSPCHRPDARQELPEAERLDDVVVGAHLQADDAIDLLSFRGHHQNRDVRATSKLPADRESVAIREPEVEQHDVSSRRLQRSLRSCGALDLEPLPT
jgi:hypothetical protein